VVSRGRGPGSAGGQGQGVKPCERLRELVGPWPWLLNAQPAAALARGDSGGDVEQPVAQGLRLGLRKVAVEEQTLGPDREVDGEHDHQQPGDLDRERAGRDLVEAGVLAGADPVFDPTWARWRASSQANCPARVSVANAV
jgi:hypothetical protein